MKGFNIPFQTYDKHQRIPKKTLENKITQLRETAVSQLERFEKATENRVESNLKKMVEQECKSIEAILKTIEAISTQIQKYNSTIKDNESKSNRIIENTKNNSGNFLLNNEIEVNYSLNSENSTASIMLCFQGGERKYSK